jgi:hypothetical protein
MSISYSGESREEDSGQANDEGTGSAKKKRQKKGSGQAEETGKALGDAFKNEYSISELI